MKPFQYMLGILWTFSLVFILLITSVEAVAYWIPGYYEKEYTKYNVTEAVRMEMSDLLSVTEEMMAYLRGGREDLHVETVVDGQVREFFNEREIAHMEDVRDLFVGAIMLRQAACAALVFLLVVLMLLKTNLLWLMPRTVCTGTGLFFLAIAALAGIIATDFTRYFTIFHELFFDNDLWILDPRTDLLINIVPEPFFVDTAARIAAVFGFSILGLFLVCIWLIRRQKGNPK